MSKSIEEIRKEFTKKLNPNDRTYVGHLFDELVVPLIEQDRKDRDEELRKKIESSDLGKVISFYESSRGSGHTYASVKGVENVSGAFLLVKDENQKKNTSLPPEKQISITAEKLNIFSGRRPALVVDHYTLQAMYYKILSLLTPIKS